MTDIELTEISEKIVQQSRQIERIAVLGAGTFGTCLAQHLADKGYQVIIWARDQVVADCINEEGYNPKYLSDFELSKNIEATSDLADVRIEEAEVLLISIPTQSMRQVLKSLSELNIREVMDAKLLICAAKGIENKTLCLPIDIISDVFGEKVGRSSVILSGPSFAIEVIAREPTAVSVASFDDERAMLAQLVFHTPQFRAYTSSDPVGLEIAGALKNVIAIASGAAGGLNMQQNARAALLTRGLAEIRRFGTALGANPITFIGLGGVGDLFLTCTSEKSRNYSVGYGLGQGKSLERVLEEMNSVAEGVTTAKAAWNLAKKYEVDSPMIDQVYNVLYCQKNLQEAVTHLLNRNAKSENH